MDSDALYPDPEWQKYVDELGQKLLEHSPDKGREYYFFMLDSPEINAFATADAYIYVNRGLVTFMNSEDQLAAVIGHEIAHVVARHPAKRRTTGLLGLGAGLAAMALTGRQEMMQVADAATRTMIAGYGRDMELEADRIGAEIMARAGYNPLAVIEAVHVLKDQELFSLEVKNQPGNYHGLFATHPQNDKRLHEVVGYALEMLPETTEEQVRDFWQMMDGLSYGLEAQYGINDQKVYYDKKLRLSIEFPDDWRVTFNSQQVMGQAPGGRDESWINVIRIPDAEGEDLDSFLHSTLRRNDVESQETLDLDCCQVLMAELSIESTDNKRALLAIRKKGTDFFVVRGEAGPNGDADLLREDVESIVTGIRNLRVSDLDGSAMQRVRVVEAKPGDTYEKFANESSLRDYPVDTLRLINGHHPHGEPRAGDHVKIVK